MRSFTYQSGEELRKSDRITYHGNPREVEFVLVDPTGEAATGWYLEKFPGGGIMIYAEGFGNVFLEESDTDEDPEFLSKV